MRFIATADTDVGISKDTNQDSLLIKHAFYDAGEVLFAVVCDGMGGLSKGEIVSATVVKTLSKWFDEELPYELEHLDMGIIGSNLALLLRDLNLRILDKSRELGQDMGTTCTAILFVDSMYVFVHVGDSRLYYIGDTIEQMTEDHTFVAREVARGNMSKEDAQNDKRRNLLLQCIGASEVVEPQMEVGYIKKGVYMICCDGFRHEVTSREFLENFAPELIPGKAEMHRAAAKLIELNKQRNEKDNISVLLVRAD